MTREEAAKEIKKTIEQLSVYMSPDDDWVVALTLAISALRTQQAHTKLDRSRWEGCWSCNNPKVRNLGLRHGREYCPCCGKPLTGKAWGELERRIGGL